MTTEITQLENVLIGKQTIEDYPYGFRLRTTMYMWVEFKKNKGYRVVSQTVNPKTNRLNKPKAGVYSHFAYLTRNEETGYVEAKSFNFYGFESVVTFMNLLKSFKFEINDIESQELYAWIITCIRGNCRYCTLAKDATHEQLIEATAFKAFVGLYKNHADIYAILDLNYDIEAINALKI